MIGLIRWVINAPGKIFKWGIALALTFTVVAVSYFSDTARNYELLLFLSAGALWIARRLYIVWRRRQAVEAAPTGPRYIEGKLVPDVPVTSAHDVPRRSPDGGFILRGLPDYGKVLLGLPSPEYDYIPEPVEVPTTTPLREIEAPPPPSMPWKLVAGGAFVLLVGLLIYFNQSSHDSFQKPVPDAQYVAPPTPSTQQVPTSVAVEEKPDLDAMNSLANNYFNGKGGVEKNEAKAIETWHQCAELGNSECQYNYGISYQNGEGGLIASKKKALSWIKKSAAQGYDDAVSYLAKSDTPAPAQAAATPSQAYTATARNEGSVVVSQGNTAEPAPQLTAQQLALRGDNYYAGKNGYEKDPTEAARWYRMAAEQGHAGSQRNLATMMFNGDGVPLNKQAAAMWYAKAADQGDSDAQNNLATMLHRGDGVTQNDTLALKLYQMAAAQGDADAKQMVERLTPHGREDSALVYQYPTKNN